MPIKTAVETAKGRGVPRWLELDAAKLQRQGAGSCPTRDDVQLPIQEQLIVELYSK